MTILKQNGTSGVGTFTVCLTSSLRNADARWEMCIKTSAPRGVCLVYTACWIVSSGRIWAGKTLIQSASSGWNHQSKRCLILSQLRRDF